MLGTNGPEQENFYIQQPWAAFYDSEQLAAQTFGAQKYPDVIAAFDGAVAHDSQSPAIIYFDRKITYAELDELSDAFAVALAKVGFGKGDRLAVFLQNVPQFIIAALAAWKLNGTLVPINPMNTAREVSVILADSRPSAMIAHDTLYRDVVALSNEKPTVVFTTSVLDFQSRNDARIFAGAERLQPMVADFLDILGAHRGQRPVRSSVNGDDVAMLVYTSGTTGVPKGAMNTHAGAVLTAESIARWMHIDTGAPVLGMAPLFHITGLVAGIVMSFVSKSPLVMSFRFHPNVTAESVEDSGAQVTFCAITALMAMLNESSVKPEQLRTLNKIITGGAPMPPAVLAQFREKFGHYIYHGYGMTETNGPVLLVPEGQEAPIDALTGALSVGIPTPHTTAWIADEEGKPVPVGDQGEVVICGRSLVAGYWDKPKETTDTMKSDGLRSGDIGFMDAAGWFYLVDRKKDMINAGGYKVWPREVEDVIYTHPSVREAAVVGAPDAYRGETVRAIVSLKQGACLTKDELTAFCKERMAAYKYPRIIEIIDDLPKTSSGKILRRTLRDLPVKT